MKVGKPKSKRVPVRLRHKIEKASAAKQRKQRKEAKKNPQWRSRLKKDPGIPNLFPQKDQVLAEIEESKRKREEDAQRRRDLARAQRQGLSVTDTLAPAALTDDPPFAGEDPSLIDPEDDPDAMDHQDESNPMAALLASAQARAQTFTKTTTNTGASASEGDDDDDDDDDDEEWAGVDEKAPATNPRLPPPSRGPKSIPPPPRKTLPKQALEDPVKAVSLLLDRLQKRDSHPLSGEGGGEGVGQGFQRLLDHYGLPPLVTAGGDAATRFLVEVARKRGRLGRGGVPNLRAAGLTVLGDLAEGRVDVGAVGRGAGKVEGERGGGVRIVKEMAEPFRIEGLFGGEEQGGMGMGMEMEE